MTVEVLLVTSLVVLPGYVGLLALRFLTADDDVATWEIVARSLIISVVSALPVFLGARMGLLGGHRDYLLGSQQITIEVIAGVVFHMISAVAMSVALAKLLTSRWVQRLGRSLFHNAWDWLWFRMLKGGRQLVATGADFLLLDERQIRYVQVIVLESAPRPSKEEKH